MGVHGIETYAEYVDFLEVHPDEFPLLFNTILINVTAFFRDADTWEYLAREVVPRLLERGGPSAPIRVWVAGCASGEEAYSIAMLLADRLSPDEFRDRVKIYATDLDEEALDQARAAVYTERVLDTLPTDKLEKYFDKSGKRYIFDRNIRRSIIFGKHDLVQDAPISHIDLLLCRNTLMYFNAEAQDRILARFHFALNDNGFLVLGKAETLLSHTATFPPADLQRRVFKKANVGRVRDPRSLLTSATAESVQDPQSSLSELREASFDLVPIALIVVDLSGHLAVTNACARRTFQVGVSDVGRPLQDLEISYRPAEIRSSIQQVIETRRPVRHSEIVWQNHGGDWITLDIQVQPVMDPKGQLLGVSVSFEDVTGFKRLQEELMSFNQELETAYEEVQSTNEELQTTNEELQSTVEELETTNEELHSTNEELETMNEELQSSNEELETINEEVRIRSEQLNRANFFLESVLSGLRDSVVVLNADLEVLAWNHQSELLWGLRSDEVVGKHFLNLDIGLPVERLRQPIKACQANGSVNQRTEVTLPALNRRGQSIECVVCINPLRTDHQPHGVILLIQEKPTQN